LVTAEHRAGTFRCGDGVVIGQGVKWAYSSSDAWAALTIAC